MRADHNSRMRILRNGSIEHLFELPGRHIAVGKRRIIQSLINDKNQVPVILFDVACISTLAKIVFGNTVIDQKRAAISRFLALSGTTMDGELSIWQVQQIFKFGRCGAVVVHTFMIDQQRVNTS